LEKGELRKKENRNQKKRRKSIMAAGWSSKRAGFESGGAGERSFQKQRRRESEFSFLQWRAALIGSLARDNIPYEVLDDETIIAEFGGSKRRMSPELQQENYKRDLEKYYQKIQN
jgi:hypothetical protein